MKDYKFIIIDGYIETVGEIHHLLDQAYKTKVPHVIFCFGMSNEVDHVIKYNNTHSKFEIFCVRVLDLCVRVKYFHSITLKNCKFYI